jgi:hypothetical protein
MPSKKVKQRQRKKMNKFQLFLRKKKIMSHGTNVDETLFRSQMGSSMKALENEITPISKFIYHFLF